MKLCYSDASPFVRKVVIAAIETGLDGQIALTPTAYRDGNAEIVQYNPLGKVPALVLDDGEVIIDSPVICDYLDGLHDGPKLIPPVGAERRRALYLQSLGDGIIEATIQRMLERFRPEDARRPDVDTKQKPKIDRALDQLEANADWLDGPHTIGQISIAAALDFLSIRIPDEDWGASRPRLAAWFAAYRARPAMRRTAPPTPA